MSKEININLSESEALVFFEWLIRFNNQEHRSSVDDSSEERVLFDLESKLEELLTQTFEPNYKEVLEKARSSLRDG